MATTEPMADYEDYQCPLCAGSLETRFDCPGFTRDGIVWVCSGGICGNGDVVSCTACDYEHFLEGTARTEFSNEPPVKRSVQ